MTRDSFVNWSPAGNGTKETGMWGIASPPIREPQSALRERTHISDLTKGLTCVLPPSDFLNFLKLPTVPTVTRK